MPRVTGEDAVEFHVALCLRELRPRRSADAWSMADGSGMVTSRADASYSIMERWVGTCRRELLDRMPIWNQAHLLHALREFETHYNPRRPHSSLGQDAPLQPAPEPNTGSADIVDLNVRRRDRLDGILHEYEHAA
jgi:transposase InsO family protein